MPHPMKQRKASSGVQTIGSPRTLKLVLTNTGQPVRALKDFRRAWIGVIGTSKVRLLLSRQLPADPNV